MNTHEQLVDEFNRLRTIYRGSEPSEEDKETAGNVLSDSSLIKLIEAFKQMIVD